MKRITPAAELAATFKPAEPDAVFELGDAAQARALTVRMPLGRFIWLQVLSARSGRSRNEMANELIRVGLSELLAQMEPDVRREIEHDVSAIAGEEGLSAGGEEL